MEKGVFEYGCFLIKKDRLRWVFIGNNLRYEVRDLMFIMFFFGIGGVGFIFIMFRFGNRMGWLMVYLYYWGK